MTKKCEYDYSRFKILHCPDRIVITGTSQDLGYESAMRGYCRSKGIDQDFLAAWARPLTERIRTLAEEAACHSGIDIVDCNRFKGRKDDFVKDIIRKGGYEIGLPLAVFKSMENCRTFYRSQSKMESVVKGSPFRLRQGKCLHYYIYFIDDTLGLVCLRIQSYAPFGIQYIINGHDVLARMLEKHSVKFIKDQNSFTYVSDYAKAQELAHTIQGPLLQKRLEDITKKIIPLEDILPNWYRLCVRQVEMSTDIYPPQDQDQTERMRGVIRQLCLQDPDEMLTYLTQPKRALTKPEFNLHTTHLGVCAKFHQKTTSIKVYHKNSSLIRIETTAYDLTKISAMRTIRRRDGTTCTKRRPLARALADIQLFFQFAFHANNRMKERLAIYWNRAIPTKELRKISNKTEGSQGTFSGMNILNKRDSNTLACINSPQFDIAGFKRADLIKKIACTKSQASYALKRLKSHGIIKKQNRSHRYFITKKGRATCTAATSLDLLVLSPIMAA